MKIKFIAILLVLSVILSMVSTGCSNEATQFTPWENSHWEKLLSGSIDAFAIDPKNTNTIYVARGRGKMDFSFQTDEEAEDKNFGVLEKSKDGGKSWTVLIKEGEQKISINAIYIDEENSKNIWILENDELVLFSSDGGLTFKEDTQKSKRDIIMMYYDSFSNENLPVEYGLRNPDYNNGFFGAALYFSLDSGSTWNNTLLPPLSGIFGLIGVDPKNPNTLYTFGISGLFKRVKGKGDYEYEPVSDSLNTSEIFIDPNNQNSLYAVSHPYFTDFDNTMLNNSRNGIFASFHSLDSGKTWEKLGDYYFNPLLPDAQLMLERTSKTSLAKKLSVSFDNGQSFKPSNLDLTKTDMDYLVICSIAVGENGIIYLETPLGCLFKSEDKGLTWSLINNLKDYDWEPTEGETTFNSRLIVSTYDPNTVYWATELLKSTDAGKTWEKLNVPQLGRLHRGSAITIDPNNHNIIYLGITGVADIVPPPAEEQMKQGLYISRDNGNTFEKLGFDGYRISAISVSPNTGIIYVGILYNGLFKSTDNGKTWERIPLDDDIHLSISSLSIDTKNNIVYAGVFGGGIFKIEDKK